MQKQVRTDTDLLKSKSCHWPVDKRSSGVGFDASGHMRSNSGRIKPELDPASFLIRTYAGPLTYFDASVTTLTPLAAIFARSSLLSTRFEIIRVIGFASFFAGSPIQIRVALPVVLRCLFCRHTRNRSLRFFGRIVFRASADCKITLRPHLELT